MLNQKGFLPILFAFIILVISGGIVGGSYYMSKTHPELVKRTNPNTISQVPQPSISPQSSSATIPTPSLQPTSVKSNPLTFAVQGVAMEPNYKKGQFWKYVPYQGLLPQRSDIVIFKNPPSPENNVIKRVIGLPRERIKISGGQIYVNEQPLSEPYLTSNTLTAAMSGNSFIKEGQEVTIPEDNYFVLGDNRAYSSDSREYGYITINIVVGKLVLQVMPNGLTKDKCQCWDNSNNVCFSQDVCN